MKESHFLKNTIGEGWHIGELAPVWQKLTTREKRKLAKLIARISEASYRRGAQQLLAFCLNERFTSAKAEKDVLTGKLRRSVTLDKSPCHDGRMMKISALDRLEIEYGSTLRGLGFNIFGRYVV